MCCYSDNIVGLYKLGLQHEGVKDDSLNEL